MKGNRKQDEVNFDVSIRPKEWTAEELAEVKAYLKARATKRTPGQKLRAEILTITYTMEEYVDNEKITEKQVISLEEFLHRYLVVLNISFRRFAQAIDTTDANLKKYLSGDRKFSTDLALRFANFFHTTPDLWMKVNIKNELLQLKREKKEMGKYKKYDYEKLVNG